MKIENCAAKINTETYVKAIAGHVYKHQNSGTLYLCVAINRERHPVQCRLFSLATGAKFTEGTPFGVPTEGWRDVTDEVKVVLDK